MDLRDEEAVRAGSPFGRSPHNGFRDVIDTKLTGSFLVAAAVVPRMLTAGSGRIVRRARNPRRAHHRQRVRGLASRTLSHWRRREPAERCGHCQTAVHLAADARSMWRRDVRWQSAVFTQERQVSATAMRAPERKREAMRSGVGWVLAVAAVSTGPGWALGLAPVCQRHWRKRRYAGCGSPHESPFNRGVMQCA